MSQPPRTPHSPRPRLPAFQPVPIRTRCDGWVPWRQADFVGKLAETGSVAAAAAFVGMARETAYRLRRKPGAEEFAHAWDAALAIHAWRTGKTVTLPRTLRPRKVSHAPTWRAICDGQWQAILRRGKYAGSYQKAEFSALSSYLAQIDRSFRESRKALRRELRSQAENARSASTRAGGRNRA